MNRSGAPPDPPAELAPYVMSWSFVLEPNGASATHLVVRVRGDYPGTTGMEVRLAPLLVLHELMERRQLHNLKARAEGARG
jgi:hypothetical protein